MSSRDARDLTEALDTLVRRKLNGSDNSDNSIPAAKDRGGSPPQTSSQLDAAGKGGGSKQGINSPLTETVWADREFFEDTLISSTDGIFVLRIAQIRTQKFTDAAGENVVFNYKEKPA